MVQCAMQTDAFGSIYWLCQDANNNVKIYKHNPDIEMNDERFIQIVFTFSSETVYFFFCHLTLHKFFIMDSDKRVKVLSKD